MESKFLHKFKVNILDASNLKEKEWELITCVSADTRMQAIEMLKEFYEKSDCRILKYELLEVIMYYEK